MWDRSDRFAKVDVSVGSLLVTGRYYLIGAQTEYVPGHIGIVTGIERGEISFLHASPRAGLVEERPLMTTATMMGSITVSAELLPL